MSTARVTTVSPATARQRLADADAALNAAEARYLRARDAMALDPSPANRSEFTAAGRRRASAEDEADLARRALKLLEEQGARDLDAQRKAARLAAQKRALELRDQQVARYSAAADKLEQAIAGVRAAEAESVEVGRSERAGLDMGGVSAPNSLGETSYNALRTGLDGADMLLRLLRDASR